MKVKIQYRLFLTLLAATALAVVSMFFIMQWSIDRGFLKYINRLEQRRVQVVAKALEETYAERGNWRALRNDPKQWRRLLRRSQLIAQEIQQDQPALRRGRFNSRLLLLNAKKEVIAGPAKLAQNGRHHPLKRNGKTIGYLTLAPRKQLSDILQRKFLREQKKTLALVAGCILCISAVFALPLAGRLVRPIRALARGTRRLTGGDFEARVKKESEDELGQLADDFNTLALTLGKNEGDRKRWVADISHELRTPLSVLRGEIEAIQDGIRPLNKSAVASLHTETLQLTRLVEDLHQLSLSDIGALSCDKSPLEFIGLLKESLESFRTRFADREIQLIENFEEEKKAWITADSQRMHQLIENLLENSLKYTDSCGALKLTIETFSEKLIFKLEDSPPGVPPTDLERLFERLYRVETSRNRKTGGAGLGLPICKNIVEAHAGSIEAKSSELGGLGIVIELPLSGARL